jgi:isopenicillin-N N-acyltransferase-like protein
MNNSKNKRRLKVVEVSGSHYDMGFQHGTACPEEINKMLDICCNLFGGHEDTTALVEKYVPLHLPPTEEYAPEIVSEMKGIADGANVDFNKICLINFHYEMTEYVHAMLNPAGCTSFAASGEATKTGEPIIGQNMDIWLPMEEASVILKRKPAEGPESLSVTPAGSVGLMGLNSAGIGLNVNMLLNRDSMSPTGGIPFFVIARKILSCKSLSEAIQAIASAKRASSANYLLANDTGDIIDIETTVDDLGILHPEREFFTHANHFETERFKSTDLAPVCIPCSFIRSNRLATLMGKQWGSLSTEVMMKLMQDHNNHPYSICAHPDLNGPVPEGFEGETVVSIISNPKERKAHITLGPPCENEYMEYKL